MTIDQIKAELRRSACEDECPFPDVHISAFKECWVNWTEWDEAMEWLRIDDLRTFFLLVAEAL